MAQRNWWGLTTEKVQPGIRGDLGFPSEQAGITWNPEWGGQPWGPRERLPWSCLEPQAQDSRFEGRSLILTGAGSGRVGSWEWP